MTGVKDGLYVLGWACFGSYEMKAGKMNFNLAITIVVRMLGLRVEMVCRGN